MASSADTYVALSVDGNSVLRAYALERVDTAAVETSGEQCVGDATVLRIAMLPPVT